MWRSPSSFVALFHQISTHTTSCNSMTIWNVWNLGNKHLITSSVAKILKPTSLQSDLIFIPLQAKWVREFFEIRHKKISPTVYWLSFDHRNIKIYNTDKPSLHTCLFTGVNEAIVYTVNGTRTIYKKNFAYPILIYWDVNVNSIWTWYFSLLFCIHK